ncbi:hypothetical protein [Pelomicrobium methylotrophicum]|uniref:Haemolysin-type calcium binding-related domain-containing protein n=1 Tax=Pelomicrobium methylotrophicum TaxID=2602750 RepID=A0A5C7EYM4_9PROT|nr:hypothetical protein [Pelomicrobium methylotrophicum]TXF13716.1 hypothetical protein FR698_01000 [Pelomicrobium methylotrophicum]
MLYRFNEYHGTLGNDQMLTGTWSANFALSGDDILQAKSNSNSNINLGGAGNDTYILSNNATMTILDSGGVDRLVATGISLFSPYSWSITIDGGRHILAGNYATGQTVAIANWRNPTNQIEWVTLKEGTFSVELIAALLPSMSGYLGDFSIDYLIQAGFFLSGTTRADVEELINYLQQRETAMEQMAQVLKHLDIGWDTAKDIVLAHVDRPDWIFDVSRQLGINNAMLAALVRVQTDDVKNYFLMNGYDANLLG